MHYFRFYWYGVWKFGIGHIQNILSYKICKNFFFVGGKGDEKHSTDF